ncbi:MAG: hypothetical protein ACLRPD_12290 [Megamonas funiformis]|uniref:hypothetical protein n=1 Tax=Megamonas funiformis TaxID=437897 RepID=UPI003990660E
MAEREKSNLMNVLEKILEEIKEVEKKFVVGHEVLFALGATGIATEIEEIIRSHMLENDDWVPVEERLPEEHDSIFAKFKGTSKWNGAMWEKRSDEVNVTYELEDGTRKATTSYTLDGVWKLEKESKVVKKKVVAWKQLPKRYNPNKKVDA